MTLRNAFEDLAVESTASNTNSILNDSHYNKFHSLRVINVNSTQFGEVLSAERTPIIELNSTYGVSELRDNTFTTGSGQVANGDSAILISSGTTANSLSRLESAEIGRYMPGYSAQIGIGARILNTEQFTSTDYVRFGGIGETGNDGIYFEYTGDGLFAVIRKSGLNERIASEDFNIDTLDGNGPSGYVWSSNFGNIYQIEFTWYGYGQILFGVIGTVEDTTIEGKTLYQQHFIPCHSYVMTTGGVSLESPNLRISIEVKGSTTANTAVEVGGRQYSIIGKYSPRYRFTGEYAPSKNTTTSVTPLISFKRKPNFGNRSIRVQSAAAIGTGEPHILQLRIGANTNTTNSDFVTPTDHTTSETALMSNNLMSTISGGIVIWQKLISAGGVNKDDVLTNEKIEFDLPDDKTVTLCAKTVSGTGSIAASELNMREEW